MPDYFWGNQIMLHKNPKILDYDFCLKTFTNEFSDFKNLKHLLFTFDKDVKLSDSLRSSFTKNNFKIEATIVLSKKDTLNFKSINKHNISVKKISHESDWAQVKHLNLLVNEDEEGISEEFIHAKYNDYRKLINGGHGSWYGAFIGEKLVADFGLIGNKEFGRFQNVETHPELRNRGICKHLVATISQRAFRNNDHKELIIEAEEGSVAYKIYKSLGFTVEEELYEVFSAIR